MIVIVTITIVIVIKPDRLGGWPTFYAFREGVDGEVGGHSSSLP
jgi:hypothetical protein